jgi:hypothetical protein
MKVKVVSASRLTRGRQLLRAVVLSARRAQRIGDG